MKEITGISERIIELIEHQSINSNTFAKKLEYDRSQTVYDIINGKSAPSYDFFRRFINTGFSEIYNIEWLITGKGSMLRGEAIVKESEAVHVAPAGNIDLLDRIERLSKENGVLEARISELEREKKTQGTVYYGTAADKVMKYGQEEK